MSTPLTILHEGHRKVVRIGANDNMSIVLQAATRAFGITAAPESTTLTHKRIPVDLSQPFRFTGIPQNATLELTVGARPRVGKAAGSSSAGKGSQVRVAVRLPGGRRVQSSFSSDTTLVDLLRWWADRGEMDAGVLQQGPTLQFMRTAYGGDQLQSTTLRSIGLLTGTAMFTLSLSAASGASPPLASSAAVSAGAGGVGGGAGTSEAFPSDSAEREAADLARAIALSKAEALASGSGTVEPVPMDHDSETAKALPGDGGSERAPPLASSEASASASALASASASGSASALAQSEQKVSEGGGGTVQGSREEGKDAAESMEVEGDGSGAAVASGEAALPTMGIDVCRAALEKMTSAHFDADSTACVITLAKMTDNIIHRPGEAKTRQIRCANAAFWQKVGRMTGGITFLEGVGFVSKPGEGPSHFRVGDGSNSVLVLPPEREDLSLLKAARALLSRQASVLGIPPERMPQPPRAPPSLAPGSSAPGAPFDPYKTYSISTAPTPNKGPHEEQSLTERRLMELKARVADVEAGGAPERNIQVTLPSRVVSASAPGGVVSAGDALYADEGGKGDGNLIAKKVARQIAERKKREDVPFQTRAMREIERLEKATVYRTTVIKVQFPDRVVVQAAFGSREGVKDLADLVRGCLSEACRGREFQLYVSPPRTILKEASSLADAGLVPAALVYVSWKAVPPAGEPEGDYLRAELRDDASKGSSGHARPQGVALDAKRQAEAKAEAAAAGRAAGVGGSASGTSGAGSKRKGTKPSWLKIN